MSVSVCPSHISGTTRPIFAKFFVHITYGRDSVLWRHSDILRMPGFTDGVIFAHKLLVGLEMTMEKIHFYGLLEVTPEHSAHAALGMAINGVQ